MSVRKSIFISAISANSLTAINIVVSMIIARLLTPEDLGAYAIAAVFVGLAHQFRDFGTSSYVVQCIVVDKTSLGKAFGLTIITSFSLGLLVIGISPFAGEFYRSPDLGYALALLGCNFFLVPFGAITLALLRRDMMFKEKAIIDHCSALAGLVTSISFAYNGFGAVSLALGTLASTLATAISANLYRPKKFPWAIIFRGLADVTRFGVSATAGNLMTQVNRGVIEVIGGRVFGLESVGMFNKAKSVTDQIGALLLGVGNQVTMPLLSSANRRGECLAPLYLKAVAILSGLVWPVCVLSIFYPLELLHVMYGPQWDAAAPMLQVLCIQGILSSPFWLWTQALLAVGKPKKIVIGEMIQLVFVVISLSAVYLSGSNNLAAALLIGTPFVLVYIFLVIRAELLFSNVMFFRSLLPSFLTTLMCLVFIYISHSLTSNQSDLLRLLSGVMFCSVGWVVGVFLFRHSLSVEIGIFLRSMLFKIKSKRKS